MYQMISAAIHTLGLLDGMLTNRLVELKQNGEHPEVKQIRTVRDFLVPLVAELSDLKARY